jgi:plastocyanin
MKMQSAILGILSVAIVAFAMKTSAVTPQSTGADVAAVQVSIDNFQFTPPSLTVKAGTMVVFTNKDDVPHTVVAESDAFRSKALDTDDQYSYRFATAGTYKYFCSLHPKMTGTILVQ